jgi:hypothetical protein
MLVLIQSRGNKHPQLAAKADTLYTVTMAAIHYIDTLKQWLLAADSTGERKEPAEQLLLHTAAGDSMLTHLQQASWYAHGGLIAKEKTGRLDSTLNDIRNLTVKKDRMNDCFRRTPTVAALTILFKLQNDCLNGALITLEDIDQHL